MRPARSAFRHLSRKQQIHRPFQTLPLRPSSFIKHRNYATTSSVSAAELEFGQPVHETHPHILKPGEITPGISAQEYFTRRANLAHSLPTGSIAVLPSAQLQYRSGAVFFPFRQESNLLYLTGFLEPDSLAVIHKTGPLLNDFTFHLFCRPKDPRLEQWSGPWSGLRAAEDVFNADAAHDIAQAPQILPTLLRSASRIYVDLPPITTPIGTTLRSLNAPMSPLQPHVNSLRAIKSPAEIANMRHAGQVSGRAITSAMRRPWKFEKDLHNYLDYAFTQSGLSGPAYVPVVAGGHRGRMIHYVHNTSTCNEGETVLVDAGGEYGFYVTDITRTWPVSGKFTDAQKDLYLAVLKVQRRCVSLCRASAGLSLDEIHRAAESGLREELTKLGFDGLVYNDSLMDVLFPHHVGHYVGLDVHDVPGYGRSVALKKGHCVTIEPGVYVPDDERFPKHFRGMAVRIEDSVCVDDGSPINLSSEAVKEVDDIEALR
ncbi:putative peptidase [Cladorrhinum sp. PSN259]|nr:putative peptidase [Cladorrhinum sp. PSN259]